MKQIKLDDIHHEIYDRGIQRLQDIKEKLTEEEAIFMSEDIIAKVAAENIERITNIEILILLKAFIEEVLKENENR